MSAMLESRSKSRTKKHQDLTWLSGTPLIVLEENITTSFIACDELVLLQANIMDASRIEVDAAALVCGSINLKETCCSVCELFESLLIQQKRHVALDIPAELTVWADEIRLKQILHNLLSFFIFVRLLGL